MTTGMVDFRDFLTRLKTLNPALELSAFPTDWLQELGGPAIDTTGASHRFLRSALFPLIVIGFIAFLATLTGK